MGFPPAGHMGPAQIFPSQALRQQQTPYAQRNIASPQQRSPYLSRDGPIPHPPFEIIPDELSRFIEVSDLTAENLTEEQYHEHLSTYVIIRFEKIEPHDKYDSDGERVIASWAKCTLRRQPNVDNGKTREEIQRLNKADKDRKKGNGISLLKKQQSLGAHAQDQVTRVGRDLAIEEQDPKRFHTVLEQLDWTERLVTHRKHSSSKRKIHERKQYERASITAYFRRCPRPDQVASELYRQLELDKYQQQGNLERQQQDLDMMQKREERDHEQRVRDQKIREERARQSRIHEERLLEQQMAQSRGPQHMQPGQHGQPMPNQGVPVLNQQQPGQRQPIFPPNVGQAPGQQYGPNGAQMRMAPQQGPPMYPLNGVQMPPQGTRPPNNGQGLPQGVQGIRLPNGQVLPQGPQGPQGIRIPNNGQQMAPQQVPGPGMRLPNNGQMPSQMNGANGNFAHPSRPNTPIRVIHKHDKRPNKNKHGNSRHSSHGSSSSSAGSESYSDFDSDSDGSTLITEASTATDSPRVVRAHKYPSHSNGGSHKFRVPRYVVEPANFGVDHRKRHPTRRHSVYERGRPEGPVYVMTGSGRRVKIPTMSSAPAPVPHDNNLAQIREAYRAGRNDQRVDDHQRTEAEDLHSTTRQYRPPSPRYNGRGTSRAEIHQDLRERGRDWEHDDLPRIRRVTPGEIDRQLEREVDLAGLRIGRGSRLEDDHDGLYGQDQRRREARAMVEQEEIMREMEEEERELHRQNLRSAFRVPLERSSGLFGRL